MNKQIALMKPYDLCDEEEFVYQMYFFNWCIKNKHTVKTVSEWEAIHIFKEDLPGLCWDKLKANEDPVQFDGLLKQLKNQNQLKMQEKKNRAKSIPIRSVVERLGYQIPRYNKIVCFMHEDSKPSLHIYERTNSWFCHVCHYGGDSIEFVVKKLNCNFIDAVNYLV